MKGGVSSAFLCRSAPMPAKIKKENVLPKIAILLLLYWTLKYISLKLVMAQPRR